MTVLLKELDLTQKTKVPGQKGEPETFDIFGLTDWNQDAKREQLGSSPQGGASSGNLMRLVFKSNSVESQNMPLYVKASLLKKCHKMRLRSDLSDGGVYIFKYWILKMMEDLERDFEIDNSSIDDLITFLARNQYKKKLAKYIIKPKNEPKLGITSSSYLAKINNILHPGAIVSKDQVKIAAYIDSEPSHYFM